MSATTNNTTADKDEREFVKLERTSALECTVGKTNIVITIQSDRFTREELERVIDRAYLLGDTLVIEAVHPLVGEFCGDSVVEDASDSIEPCFGKYIDTNGEITVVVDHEFTHEVTDLARLYTVTDELVATIVGEASTKLSELRAEEIRRNYPSPADYYERLVYDRKTPAADLVPPGLDSEHWREFVNCFAGQCSCGQPTCKGGVLKGIIYDYDELVAYGLSEEAAKAVLDNAALKHIKGAYERAARRNSLGGIMEIPPEAIGALMSLLSPDGPLGGRDSSQML